MGISVVFILITCAIAYHLGADIDWDLQNYHFYNGYLYTHGRLISGSIATEQSYIDPYLNTFYYVMIRGLSPLQVNIIISILQSLSVSFVAFVTLTIIDTGVAKANFVIASMVALPAVIGPVFWSEVGGTMGDVLLASPVILAILLLTKLTVMSGTMRQRNLYVAISGIMIGFASGLKFTNMPYAVAAFISIAIMTFVMKLPLRDKLSLILVFSVSATASLIVTYGQVGLLLWQNFHNPVFPFFSNVFRSQYIVPYTLHDDRWFPRSFVGYLELPFDFCVRRQQHPYSTHFIGMEIPFRTYLFAAIFTSIPLYFVRLRKALTSNPGMTYGGLFIVLFFVISFIVSSVVFAYYRYIAVLEIMAPLTLMVMGMAIFRPRLGGSVGPMAIVAGVLLLSLGSLPDSNWGREPFTSSYFGINKKRLAKYGDSLLVVGRAPMGFVLPYFPSSDRVIALPEGIPGVTQRFQEAYLRRLKDATGHIYYLSEYNKSLSIVKRHVKFLRQAYGLNIMYNQCKEIKTNIYPIAICAAEKR